ncbi:MAG: M50 family metallopeptidase [Myxococcales bacterium]|nr:M50 family metallopeptidase [Myxococcales bacterium]
MIGQTGKRYRLFQAFNVPVYADASVLMMLVLLLLLFSGRGPQGIVSGLIFAAVGVVGILIHEFGHALAVRKLGYGASVIVLHGLGGVTQWRGQAKRRDRILIALAGPAAGLLVGIPVFVATFFIQTNSPLVVALVQAWLVVNIGWSVFNLMPVYPMDGGHVIRTALATPRRSQRDAVRISLIVSMTTAGVLAALGLYIQLVFVVFLMAFMGYANYQEYRRLTGPPQSGSGFYGY